MTVDPSSLITELRISYENEAPLDIFLTDEVDAIEDLSPYTRARLTVFDEPGGEAKLDRSTEGPEGQRLTIHRVDDSWAITVDPITENEWDSLPVGSYVADLVLWDNTLQQWHYTDRFYVFVEAKMAEKPS